jgi:hypothetical protein
MGGGGGGEGGMGSFEIVLHILFIYYGHEEMILEWICRFGIFLLVVIDVEIFSSIWNIFVISFEFNLESLFYVSWLLGWFPNET